jgi:pilus assembly protein Flp/PilA
MENLDVLIRLVRRICADRRAVTSLEYGIIASLVAVVLISSIGRLGTSLSGTFSKVSASL